MARAKNLLESWLMQGADAVTARLPCVPASKEALRAARIVSHRGLYDNQRIFENTLAAFDGALAAGIWGLEFDVRWSRDQRAVVHHDANGQRLFGFYRPIEALDFDELVHICPLIPPLETVVRRYGKRMHLMIEIKPAPDFDPRYVNRSLGRALAGLTPGDDYHLMSFAPQLLTAIDSVPRRACLPIASLNTKATHRAAVASGCGGMTCHYALIGRRGIAAMHREGRHIGTGFVNSPRSMYRELARGVDWMFSDRALELQRMVTRGLAGI
jgi:glycerophosphoryl diester phosphodiesterase